MLGSTTKLLILGGSCPASRLATRKRVAAAGTGKLPAIGVGHIKGQVNDAYDATFDQVWKTEVTLLGVGIGDDGEEAMTAFMERRAPRFQRR